jgi:hypothetical protein
MAYFDLGKVAGNGRLLHFQEHFLFASNALLGFCHTLFENRHIQLQEIFACRVSL